MSENEVSPPNTNINSERCKNKIITCKVQGDHGIIPPDERIVKTIEEWLDELDLQGCEERVFYSLEIAGWKCFSGKVGVTLFRVRDFPFEESLEIRVRVHEEKDFLWRCFLFCPTRELAWQIALYARTDAYNWISALVNKREALPSFQIKLGNRNVKRAYAHSKVRDRSEKEVVRLSRGKGLKKLCWLINQTYGVETFIPLEKLIILVEKESGVSFSKDSCYDLMELLLDRGVIDPYRENEENGYRATAILQERAFDYENMLRKEEVSNLESRQERLRRLEASALKEISRLESRLGELRYSLVQNASEQTENLKNIQTLKSVITGSYNGDED